jgi:hypothetical protein
MKKLLFLFSLCTMLFITTSCEKEDPSNDLFVELTANQWQIPEHSSIYLEFTTDYQLIEHSGNYSELLTTFKLKADLICFDKYQIWYPISINGDTLRIKSNRLEPYYLKKH